MSIYTRKPIRALIGERIWVVSGVGHPRTYSLVGSFLVWEVYEGADGTKEAWGETVTPLARPVRIDGTAWFQGLRKATGNFAFGLQHINDAKVIDGLLATCSEYPDQLVVGSGISSGAFFGIPTSNAEVERAAIDAATKHYQRTGWEVISHETLNLGYDLHRHRAAVIRHIEVKGVRGSNCSFILTANEKDFAARSDSFRLCVVVNALDPTHRAIREFTNTELNSDFSIEPLAFAVRLKS